MAERDSAISPILSCLRKRISLMLPGSGDLMGFIRHKGRRKMALTERYILLTISLVCIYVQCLEYQTMSSSPLILQLDNFLLDRFKIGDALLFKGFGVYFTKNVLLKTLYYFGLLKNLSITSSVR